jgi:diguanylate cyclase (GGDEF)-like protein/PAS domain S-box-containing protein
VSAGNHNERVLAALLDASEHALLTISVDGTIENWSSGAEQLYGYREEEIVGRPVAMLVPLYEIPAMERLLKSAAQGEILRSGTAERLRKDGSLVVVNLKRRLVRATNGEAPLILETGQERNHRNGNNPLESHLYRLIEQLPLVLWTTDRNLRITSNWGSGSEAAKIRPGEFVGKTVYDLLKCHDPGGVPILQHQNGVRGLSSRFEHCRDGRVLDIQIGPLWASEGDIIGCAGVALDITERKKLEEDVRFQATHDALTGLANYREFLGELERELRRSDRSHRPFAVLLLDLDNLKMVNDRYGHLTGNRALKRLAAAMKEHSRSVDLAARYGGDEFALLLIDADPGMAEQVAERIAVCLRGDTEIPALTVSIGMAISPDDGRSVQEVLETADKRLYRRKGEARTKAV